MKRLLSAAALLGAALIAFGSTANAQSSLPHAPTYIGVPEPTRIVKFTLHVPLRNRAELEGLIRMQSDKNSPLYRHFLTVGQFRSRYGLTPQAVDTIRRTFAPQGLSVVSTGSQDVVLAGNVSAVEHALNTTLVLARSDRGNPRLAARGTLTVPAALRGATVIGLDAAILKHPHSVVVKPTPANVTAAHLSTVSLPHNELSPLGGYLTSDLKQAYSYPSYRALTGETATIAVLMDGGPNRSDITRYFSAQHLPTPLVSERTVDGGTGGYNDIGDYVETTLDIEQSGGMAPQAKILHYDIPDLSDTSTYDGYKAIVEDDAADVISSSFGICERYYNGLYAQYFGPTYVPSTLYAFSDLYAQGNAQGQTFVASSGDYGAVACLRPSAFQTVNADDTPILGVESPASDPYVAAVGGTNLVTTYAAHSHASRYVRENAFGDKADPTLSPFDWGSGGGESQLFPQPYYQKQDGFPARGRTVPDLAGHMGGCPYFALAPCGPDRSSVLVFVDGAFINVIGTSASAPDFAGLIALARQAQGGRFGLITPAVYADAAINKNPITYFNAVIPGSNGLPSHPGYDEITGVGTVLGLPFAGLPFGEAAGDPGTPSNPGPSSATPAGQGKLSYENSTYAVIGANSVDLHGVPKYTPAPTSSASKQPQANALPRTRAGGTGFGGMTAQKKALLVALAPRSDSARTSTQASAANFDGCNGDCAGFGFAASDAYRITATEGVALTGPYVTPALFTVYDPNGHPAAGFPKRLETLLGINHVDANGVSPANCRVSGGLCLRFFYNVHAFFDAASRRYWLYAVENDSFDGDTSGLAASTWFAISDTADPSGTWKSYQYALDDGDDFARFVNAYHGGFAVNATTIAFSADVVANDYVGEYLYSYVATVDRRALESGHPQRAFGARHLRIGGNESSGQIPVQPRTPADSTGGNVYFLSTSSEGCALFCSGVVAWTIRAPGPHQQLSIKTIPTARYLDPPNWSHDSFQPIDDAIRSNPILSGGTVSFAFASARGTQTGERSTVRWDLLALHPTTAGEADGTETAVGEVVAANGHIVGYGETMPDGLGRVYVSYVEFDANENRIEYFALDAHGKAAATQTAYVGSGGLYLEQFSNAAASIGSTVLFMQPYSVDTNESGRVVVAH